MLNLMQHKVNPPYPAVSQLSRSWCFLSHTRWKLQAPLPCSTKHAALVGEVPAESGGEEHCAMCRDLAPSSPAVVLPSAAPAPIKQRRLQAGSCQLSKPDRLPVAFHIWKSLPWESVQEHLCILTSTIIFKVT